MLDSPVLYKVSSIEDPNLEISSVLPFVYQGDWAILKVSMSAPIFECKFDSTLLNVLIKEG